MFVFKKRGIPTSSYNYRKEENLKYFKTIIKLDKKFKTSAATRTFAKVIFITVNEITIVDKLPNRFIK